MCYSGLGQGSVVGLGQLRDSELVKEDCSVELVGKVHAAVMAINLEFYDN